MAEYELLMQTPYGIAVGALDKIFRCSYARVENNIGEMSLSIPPIYPIGWFARDSRILIQRSVGSGSPALDMQTPWFVQDITDGITADGRPSYEIKCVDAIAILSYAIVAYNANNAFTLKLAALDDMMKAIVRENMGSLATDTTRNLSTYMRVAADVTGAPVAKKDFSRRVVLDILRELADASLEAGTYLAFDVVQPSANISMLEFRTYVGQRGNDHRHPGGNPPLLLDINTDTMSDVSFSERHLNEKTYIYAGGAGVADVRPIGTAFDQARIDASPFGRRELFLDENGTTEVVVLQAAAQAALVKNKPLRHFSGKLLDGATVLRGVDYDFGDFLTASYNNQSADVHLNKVGVTISEGGSDSTDISMEAES